MCMCSMEHVRYSENEFSVLEKNHVFVRSELDLFYHPGPILLVGIVFGLVSHDH